MSKVRGNVIQVLDIEGKTLLPWIWYYYHPHCPPQWSLRNAAENLWSRTLQDFLSHTSSVLYLTRVWPSSHSICQVLFNNSTCVFLHPCSKKSSTSPNWKTVYIYIYIPALFLLSSYDHQVLGLMYEFCRDTFGVVLYKDHFVSLHT